MLAERTLVVLPDSDRVEQALVDAVAHRGFVDASGFVSFGQLLQWCEPARVAGKVPVGRLELRALVGRLAPERCREAFGDFATTPDFAFGAAELLAQLVNQGARPGLLFEASARLSGSGRTRAAALAKLWAALSEELERLGRFDPAEAVLLATVAVLKNGLPPRLARFQSLEVRGLHDLPPARLAFLDALAGAAEKSGRHLAVRFPGSGGPAVDLALAPALKHVEATWQELASAEASLEIPETPLSSVAPRAFAEKPSPASAPGLDAFSAATPSAERLELARRARRLVDAGTPPEAIAVALRDLAQDAEALVEAFDAVGLPARARLGVPLTQAPIGRLTLGLFELVEEDFPADAVAGVLQSRYARSLFDGCPDPWRLFGEAGLRNDALGARDGQGALAERLRAQAKRAASHDTGLSERYLVVAERVELLVRTCRAIPAKGTALALLEAFWAAVESLGILEALRRVAPVGGEDGRGGAVGRLDRALDRALARDQAAAEALFEMVTSFREALESSGLGARVMERRELARWLSTAAADVNLAARGPRTGAVWLLDVRELAARRFEHVFLGGLVDGRFPGRPPPLPLLSEEERTQLNLAAGRPLFRLTAWDGELELPVRAAEDRLLLHHALSAGTKSVTVSRARSDEDGKELLASPFLEALRRGVVGFEETHVGRSPVPRLDDVVTEEQLRLRAAVELVSPELTRQERGDARALALAAVLGGEAWLEPVRRASAMETERLVFFTAASDLLTMPPSTPYSGRVRDPLLLARLAEVLAFGPEHPASASTLSTWGTCAFKGMSQKVLGLVAPEERGEELAPRDSGTLAHGALAHLVPGLLKDGLWGPHATREALRPRVREAVKVAADELGHRIPTGHPALWRLQLGRTERMLVEFLMTEAARPFEGLSPQGVEVPFGDPRSPAELQQVVVPAAFPSETDVHVYGRIDRLDGNAEAVAVLDYKSGDAGKSKARRDAMLETDFQLPLYLLALRTAWPGKRLDAGWAGLMHPDTLTFSDLTRKTELDVEELLATDAETRATLKEESATSGVQTNLANAVHGLLGRLRAGELGPRSLDCTFCDFSAVCRISSRQVHPGEEGGE